jgi:predicted Rossmann fold nucleotide-binding protein DprA/Smf involved in DNA uptake
MRVAIVGSRGYASLGRVFDYVTGLPEGTVVISGGARDVDAMAAGIARTMGLTVIEFLPNYEAHGRRAPLIRNKQIAQHCERMVAFWDGKSTGTAHAIRCAKSLGRPVEVIR